VGFTVCLIFALIRKFSPNEPTDLNILMRFAVVPITFKQKIMRPVRNSLKNQCYILHMIQRTEYFEQRAIEFCVSATLVSCSWIVPKNTSTRLERYCYWQSFEFIALISFRYIINVFVSLQLEPNVVCAFLKVHFLLTECVLVLQYPHVYKAAYNLW